MPWFTAKYVRIGATNAPQTAALEAAKKSEFLDPEKSDLGESLGPRKHAHQAQEQNLIERVSHLPLLTRVLEVLEITQKDNRFGECSTARCCAIHCRSPLSESRIGIDSAL